MAVKKRTNPFYALLLLIGFAFFITTCTYGVMTFRAAGGTQATRQADRANSFLAAVDRYGVQALAIELGLLAVCTLGVIATDRHWSQKTDVRDRIETQTQVTADSSQPSELESQP